MEERVLALPLEPGEPDDLARVQLEVDPVPVGRSRTPSARSTTSLERGRSGRACPVSVRCSAPVINRTSSDAGASPRRRVATVSPERITVTRSPISSTSSIRCEMKIVLVPSSARRRTMANSRSRVATSSADVASSRTRTRGRRMRARAMQHACRSLRDSSSTGRPRSGSDPVSSPSSPRRARPAPPSTRRPGAAGRSRATGCRGSTAAGRRALPGRRRRSRGRAPPGESRSRPASVLPLDRAAVGAVDAGEHLDDGALARSVLAHDRVHLAALQVEGAGGDRPRRAEGLGEVDRPERERRARAVDVVRIRDAHAAGLDDDRSGRARVRARPRPEIALEPFALRSGW